MGDMGGGGKDGFSGDPLLWIVPLAGVGIAAMYLIFKNKNRLASAMMPTMIVAVLGLLIMGFTFIKIQDKQSEFTDGMSDVGSSLGNLGSDDSSGEKSEPSSSNADFGQMMGGMGLKIEWGFWLTAIAFGAAAFGATKYRDLPKGPGDIIEPGHAISTTPPEVVHSTPPPDASMTEDKGMG